MDDLCAADISRAGPTLERGCSEQYLVGIWAAGKRPGKLEKLDQTTGRITEYTIPRQNASPYDVMQDPDGNIWSADVGGSHAALWKFNTKDQTFTLYPKPQKTADTPKIQVT